MMLGFADQQLLGKQLALIRGVPNIRWVDVPRVGSGAERVDTFFDEVIKALTDPLTDKEKESGLYQPPPDPRICFEGTLDDAQEFFQKTTPIEACRQCPISMWTDGLPIIIPTEEKVAEMLTGTSHPAEEQVKLPLDISATRKAGTAMTFYPYAWSTSVEKVAVNAVMAGCKPEYMPVCLAIASTGGQLPNSNGFWHGWITVSGPIAKEIGMNAGSGSLNPGNPANASIGRSLQLMITNFGGAVQGINRTDYGSPFNMGGTCIAEDDEALPAGWLGLNEESTYYKDGNAVNYTKNDSIITLSWCEGSILATQFAPSSFRGLISEGYGGMARRLGVEGIPGPHNFLEYILPELIMDAPRSWVLMMHPAMAESLKDYGFASKAAVGSWMKEASYIPAVEYKKYGWYDTSTDSGRRNESTSGKPWNDLPDDYMVPSISNVRIIVGMAPGDETCIAVRGGLTAYPIDPWR